MSWTQPQETAEIVAWLQRELKRPYIACGNHTPFDIFVAKFVSDLKADPGRDSMTYISEFAASIKGLDDHVAELRLRILAGIKMALHHCVVASISPAGASTVYTLTQASMFVGVTKGYVDGLPDEDVEDSLLLMARAGAKGRDSKYQPMRDFARAEALKRNFPSRRNAALTLKPNILEMSKKLGVNLSEQQAEKTITGWLSDIPFASKRIPPAGNNDPSAS